MEQVTILQIFDLDETFFRMPGYTSKKHVESEDNKFDTAYAFYDHPLSLCEDSHNIQLIGPVYDAWKAGVSQEDTISVLITHRVIELSDNIFKILNKRDIEFNISTFLGRKTKKIDTANGIIESLPNLKEIQIFEDSIKQIYEYQEFFKKLNRDLIIKIYIVDKSEIYRIENVKLSEEKRIRLI